MSLFTKSIIKEKEVSDGVRISVMSRHTLNDGVTPDSRITFEKYDEHLRILAASDRLIGDYYKRGLTWQSFVERYLEQLQQESTMPVVAQLAARAITTDITLLCIELTPEKCHRRILAEECLKYTPQLVLEHH